MEDDIGCLTVTLSLNNGDTIQIADNITIQIHRGSRDAATRVTILAPKTLRVERRKGNNNMGDTE